MSDIDPKFLNNAALLLRLAELPYPTKGSASRISREMPFVADLLFCNEAALRIWGSGIGEKTLRETKELLGVLGFEIGELSKIDRPERLYYTRNNPEGFWVMIDRDTNPERRFSVLKDFFQIDRLPNVTDYFPLQPGQDKPLSPRDQIIADFIKAVENDTRLTGDHIAILKDVAKLGTPKP